jgi:23S rRNA (uracil1939-C5)-methyltransferase
MRRWEALRGCVDLLPDGTTSVVLREDRDGDVHVIVRGGEPPWSPEPLSARLADQRLSLWWEPAGGAARVVAGPRTGFPALAFAQVNPSLADRLRSDAALALGEVAGRVVWDLYGGVGDAARMLAARGAHVVSVEADATAVEWAMEQAAPNGAPAGSPRYVHARVEEVLHRLPLPDAVLMNPPRAGLAERVSDALERGARSAGPRRACYVSCDPATLARDVRRMPAFALTALTAYDLFPQTSHVETLAVLETA